MTTTYGHRISPTHCSHGTYIGGECGPDYLCQWCEDGVSDAEYNAIMLDRACRKPRLYAKMMRDFQDNVPFSARTATWVVQYVIDEMRFVRPEAIAQVVNEPVPA